MSVRSYSAQKAALTRAINTGDLDKVKAEVKRARDEWDSGEAPYTHGWPDDWSRWQRAVNDLEHWSQNTRIEDL